MAKSRPDRVEDLSVSESLIAGHMMAYHGLILTSTAACTQLTIVYSLGLDSSIWTLHFGGAKARMSCKNCFEPGHPSWL